jgi:excisionase family DNA binding protein
MESRNPRHSGVESENAGNGGHTAGEPLGLRAFRIREVCELTGLGRTSIYAAIKSGALIARRYGRCTIVLAEDLAAFLAKLPTTNGR